MKSKILDTRKLVMSAVVKAFTGGIDCAATFLNYEKPKHLENRMYGSAGSAPMSDSEIHALEQETGTTHLPDYICAMYGGVFVPLPEADQDNLDMYSRAISTQTARGKVDLMIQQALADGEISPNEAAEILAVHSKHVAARHAEVQAVIALFSKA